MANEYVEAIEAAGSRLVEDWPGADRWSYSRFSIFEDADHSGTILDRKALCRRFAWAIPSDEAIEAIVGLGPIIEVMAGTGYWAHLIADAGGDIVATDERPYQNHWCGEAWYRVDAMDAATAAGLYPERALLMVWPPYEEAAAEAALEAYGGDTVIYVGEHDGCCATPEFFEALWCGWEGVWTIGIPRWDGMHDYMTIYKRRPERIVLRERGADR